MRDRRTLNQILIYVYGRTLLSIMFTMKTLLKNLFMKTLQNNKCGLFLKDIMLPYWPMGKLELEKLIQWKDSNTQLEILKEVLFQDLWKRSSDLFRCNPLKTQLSWLEHHICRSTMK